MIQTNVRNRKIFHNSRMHRMDECVDEIRNVPDGDIIHLPLFTTAIIWKRPGILKYFPVSYVSLKSFKNQLYDNSSEGINIRFGSLFHG